jgi:hypothetical protein
MCVCVFVCVCVCVRVCVCVCVCVCAQLYDLSQAFISATGWWSWQFIGRLLGLLLFSSAHIWRLSSSRFSVWFYWPSSTISFSVRSRKTDNLWTLGHSIRSITELMSARHWIHIYFRIAMRKVCEHGGGDKTADTAHPVSVGCVSCRITQQF